MSDHQRFGGAALLVEDDPFLQQSASSLLADLGFKPSVTSTYAQAVDLLACTTAEFSLAVVDLSLPERSIEDAAPRKPLGLDIVKRVKQTCAKTGVVVWSAYTHHLPDILALVEEGYRGLAFVPKGSRVETLRRAIVLALDGDVYLPAGAIARSTSEAVAQFFHALRPDVALVVQNVESRLGQLSPRQFEVAALLTLRPDAIARELGLSEKTVRNYLDDLYENLQLKDHDMDDYRREGIVALAFLLRRLHQR